MTDEAMKAMARRIAAGIYRNQPGAHEAGYDQYIADGNNDADEAVQAAIAAIIETRDRDAAVAESMTLEMPGIGVGFADGASVARRQIAAAIRSGQQFRKDV